MSHELGSRKRRSSYLVIRSPCFGELLFLFYFSSLISLGFSLFFSYIIFIIRTDVSSELPVCHIYFPGSRFELRLSWTTQSPRYLFHQLLTQ